MTERIVKKIDINKYKENIETYQKSLSPKTELMAIVKANAYGHGLKAIAIAGKEKGVNRFAVATAKEAKELRDLNLGLPIHLLSEKNIKETHSEDIVTLFNQDQVLDLISSKEKRTVHIKVETGLGRLGFFEEEAIGVIEELKKHPQITVEGILTHMAKSSDENAIENQYQKLSALEEKYPYLCHISNSEMASKFPKWHLDMVRLGLLTYRNVMTINSEILSIKSYKKGHSFSYESLYTTPKDTVVAVLAMGYADGIPMRMHQGGSVYIKNKAYKVIGRPCMDMMMVELGDNQAQITLKDRAEVRVSELAKVLEENEWNLMCGFDRRRVTTQVS